LVIGAEHAQVGEGIGMFGQPGGAGLFEPGLEPMPMTALDHSRTYRQTQRQRAGIIQRIQPIVQVAMPGSHRGLLVRSALRFQVFGQRDHGFGQGPALESLLLRPPPGLGRGGTPGPRLRGIR
jgi:hypothetical protein